MAYHQTPTNLGTPHLQSYPNAGVTFTTPRTYTVNRGGATPSRTPSRVVPAPSVSAPALIRPLKNHVFARDPSFRSHLANDLHNLDFTLGMLEEATGKWKEEYLGEMGDLAEHQRGLEVSLGETKRLASDLIASLERERGEVEEAKSRGAELEKRRKGKVEELDIAKGELSEWGERVRRKKNEREEKRKGLMGMKGETERETQWLEGFLGLKIRGKGPDVIHFKFTFIDPNDYRRPFSFDLDASQPTYQIPECKPMLPKLAELLATLNSSRDVYTFIKAARKAFKELAEDEKSKR